MCHAHNWLLYDRVSRYVCKLKSDRYLIIYRSIAGWGCLAGGLGTPAQLPFSDYSKLYTKSQTGSKEVVVVSF